MFTWKQIYNELITTLLQYRNKQDELIRILKSIEAKGLKIISLKDIDASGMEKPLSVIDPFTFFANFNRGTTFDNRRSILSELKKVFQLKAEVPSDFDGLPIVDLRQSWFFPYENKRKPETIDDLWTLAELCTKSVAGELDDQLFERSVKIRSVRAGKLTMGLFWLNPNQYLTLDSRTVSYIEEKGVKASGQKVETLAQYLSILEKVTTKIGTDFVTLSRDAYIATTTLDIPSESLDQGFLNLLQETAEANNTSLDAVSHILLHSQSESAETEITNRINILSRFQQVLQASGTDLKKIETLSPKLWVLSNGNDSTRRHAFLKSAEAEKAMTELLDDASGVPSIDQIDDFIDSATENGYQGKKGKADQPGAAQFASALLSAKYPETFVDFRINRWNKLFGLIVGGKKHLCHGGTYGWKLVRAGSFAAKLASVSLSRLMV